MVSSKETNAVPVAGRIKIKNSKSVPRLVDKFVKRRAKEISQTTFAQNLFNKTEAKD